MIALVCKRQEPLEVSSTPRRTGEARTRPTDAARALGVSRKTLSGMLNRRVGISPEMAVRLSLAFDTTAESWLAQQLQYDLWRAERKRVTLRVKRLSAA